MTRYMVVVEKATSNYGAYLPDVDGCAATGATIEETLQTLTELLTSHFELMAEEGYPIPEPTSCVGYVDVPVPQPAKRKSA
jgi:predicted RNase H-like HicB family nuclease